MIEYISSAPLTTSGCEALMVPVTQLRARAEQQTDLERLVFSNKIHGERRSNIAAAQIGDFVTSYDAQDHNLPEWVLFGVASEMVGYSAPKLIVLRMLFQLYDRCRRWKIYSLALDADSFCRVNANREEIMELIDFVFEGQEHVRVEVYWNPLIPDGEDAPMEPQLLLAEVSA